jgi:OFA family oxalate/formate antiporter-like MFS transporter
MTDTAARGNRWAIAWAGVLVMILAGTVYAWSNFTEPLIASFGWSSTQASLVFGLAIFFIGIGAVVGGRWQDKVGPRNVTIIGIVLWGIGNLLAAAGPHDVWWWDVTYGVIGGFGNGMAYITPVATVTKWFPDKRGLASGMVVMGFGLGAFIYGFVLKAVPGFEQASKDAGAYADAQSAAMTAGTPFDAAAHAMPAADVAAIMQVLLVSGIVYAIAGGLCAMLLQNPPAGYSVAGATAAAASHEGSYTPAQVLRMPQLYLLWLMLFLNVVAGILIVSNAVPIIRELISKGVTDPEAITALTGTAISAYAFVAVFNGLGRFFWGAVSDRIGRNMTWVCIYGCQVVIFFVLAGLHSIIAVLIAFAIILSCYGGGFGTMPSFNADYFGTKYLGQNYGYIITAWGVGGLVGPYIAGAVKDRTGSYSGALLPMAVMLLIAMILPFITKKPAPAPITATA